VNIRLKFLTSHERPASIHRQTRRSPSEFNDTLPGEERREKRSSLSVTRLRDETLSPRDLRRRAALPVSRGATRATRALAPTYTVNIRYAPARGSPGATAGGESLLPASHSRAPNSRTASRDQPAHFSNPSYSAETDPESLARQRRQGGARVEKRTSDREEIASGTLRQTERGDIVEKGGKRGERGPRAG